MSKVLNAVLKLLRLSGGPEGLCVLHFPPLGPLSVPLDHSTICPETVLQLQINFRFHQVYVCDSEDRGLY